MRRPLIAALAACLLVPTLAGAAAARERPLRGLRAVEKPERTVLREAHDPARIIVKFREGSAARLRAGRFRGAVGFDGDRLGAVLAAHGVDLARVKRLVPLPDAQLDTLRDRAQRKHDRQVGSLRLYYQVLIPPGVDAAALCDALNELPFVEIAEPAPTAARPPVDIPPVTPNFRGQQSWRAMAPVGFGVKDTEHLPGADGTGITIVDIEFSWNFDHEDIELSPTIQLETVLTPIDPFSDDNHGTAVLGILGALPNAYGVSGIAPGANLLVAATETVEGFYNPARALTLATAASSAGDVILLEIQQCICNNTCTASFGLGAVEWSLATYDAIVTATGNDISVIEPAGNGNFDLDSANCLGVFDRVTRPDSGAVMVGAGRPGTRERLSFSNYGDRLDVQNWGESVTTTGYLNSVPLTTDPDQRYTGSFNGTSSASALTAGLVASIQGVRTARGLAPLSALAMRQLLVTTGLPQAPTDPVNEPIGPQPDMVAALGSFVQQCDDTIDNDTDTDADTADADCANPTDATEYALQPGDVIVADSDLFDSGLGATGKVMRVDASGNQTTLRSGNLYEDPTAVAIDGDGDILVTEFTAPGIVRLDPTTGSTTFVTFGAPMQTPWGIDIEASGKLVVADSVGRQVLRVDPTTGAQSVLSSLGAFQNPRDIAVEPSGTLLVSDQFLNAIVRVDPSIPDDGLGTNQTIFTTGGLLFDPSGIALDAANGHLYVGNRTSLSLIRIDTTTAAHTLISLGIHIKRPATLALLPGGDVLMGDDTEDAVIRIDPATGAQTLLSGGGAFVDPFGVAVVPLPEAGGLATLVCGLAGLALLRRRRQ